jgi:glucose-1-phosphatase
MRRPEWVIFDIGDVVIRLNRHLRYIRTFEAVQHGSSEARRELERMLGDNLTEGQTTFTLNEKFQLGSVGSGEFLAEIHRIIGGRLTLDELREDACAVLGPEDPEVVELIARLKQVCRVACYSNTHALHWDHLIEHYPVLSQFEVQGASHLLGYAKPSPVSYRNFCHVLGASPGECVFIDDRQLNIAGAIEAGLDAIFFRDAAQLERELADRRLLPV